MRDGTGFHSAMVSHSGQASPVWREVTALGFQLDAPGYELLGDRPVDGTLELDTHGVAIVRREA